ncbi:type I inositol polyphosphate 5-phosphatase 4-like isoform X2 [Mangifera indica]|uniref:type I inositol polyphosphate 5-phosphatase 4-like isoform X2 n=1 Tax=Mangifera indica TaxID=29780 RepID=UPI001CFA2772|nr:type I inositol polyphosphate 5-phosphatase 4-like isoform X2 [Mangifera indica]XP_044480206.1 type I inositol polyphosphate 5-phosphatase 4-like isoform X2 [Mangifera indica]
MDNQNDSLRSRRFYKWFKQKQKIPEPNHLNEVSDGREGDGNDEMEDSYFRSMAMDPCISSNELRIFVGTWNVAGRSPEGSLAVDLDEWLNLKDAADIYVLGFQEIVPLKTRTVIGAEDPTEATNWNLLIGKTLNSKYGCPWLTPMLNPISSDNYHYNGNQEPEKRVNFSGLRGILMRNWSRSQHEKLYGGSKYKLMASKKMVGVFISVWMKTELLSKYCISNVKVCSVACGIMGYLGNKGSVSVSLSIEGTSFCFIAAHLASGEKKGDEGRRNHQVSEIFRRTTFPRSSKDDDNPHPLTILGHDQIFWFGDLNYRLYLEDNLARHLIKKQDWKALQEFDQLRRELEDGGVFQGWREGDIEFAPTYKYSFSNCNRYSGGVPNSSGEKQRTPAWCDRILWYGKRVKQLSYFRSESKFSDHRPVSALFSTHVEVMKSINRIGVQIHSFLPSIITPKQTFLFAGKGNHNASIVALAGKILT